MRVLIVRLGAFGDLIHTLPLAADLQRAGWVITWLCEDRWTPLLLDNPAVDRIAVLPRARWRRERPSLSRRLQDLRGLIRRLRRESFDVVIDAQGLAKSAFFATAAGARSRIRHAWPQAREGSWLAGGLAVARSGTHIVDLQRGLGLPLTGLRSAADRPAAFPLPAWTAERAWARDWLGGQGLDRFWTLNVGAGWPSKAWPRQRMMELGGLLAQCGRRLLAIWGNADERDCAEAVVAAVPGSLLAPVTTIPRLAGLLATSPIVVSADTGPLHLAHALGRPCVGLFGPVPACRNGPRGCRARNLQAPSDPWERRDPTRSRMDQISAEAVLSAGLELDGVSVAGS